MKENTFNSIGLHPFKLIFTYFTFNLVKKNQTVFPEIRKRKYATVQCFMQFRTLIHKLTAHIFLVCVRI